MLDKANSLPGDHVRVDVGTVVIIALALFLFGAHASPTLHVDTNAFYCGARALHSGADPYRFEPLHSCEARNLTLNDNQVFPDPLPPYAIALWVPLSLLPFAQANALWLLLILASAVTIVWCVVRLTGIPFWLVGGCVFADMLLEPLANGAMAPLPIALLCATAVALMRARFAFSAVLLALACIQPHVALPAMLAAFILVPHVRAWLLVVAIAILMVAAIVGGWLNVEYLTQVLPLHAVSEFGSSNQYSLSAVLHLLGVSDKVAVAVGGVQYAVFVVLGVFLAGLLRRRIPSSIILAPLACAVTGGPFIHQTEIAGALPFAFAVAAAAPTTMAWLGVTIIAVPLEYVLDYGASLVPGLVVCLILDLPQDHQLGRCRFDWAAFRHGSCGFEWAGPPSRAAHHVVGRSVRRFC